MKGTVFIHVAQITLCHITNSIGIEYFRYVTCNCKANQMYNIMTENCMTIMYMIHMERIIKVCSYICPVFTAWSQLLIYSTYMKTSIANNMQEYIQF